MEQVSLGNKRNESSSRSTWAIRFSWFQKKVHKNPSFIPSPRNCSSFFFLMIKSFFTESLPGDSAANKWVLPISANSLTTQPTTLPCNQSLPFVFPQVDIMGIQKPEFMLQNYRQ
jgi:hypothetical protein